MKRPLIMIRKRKIFDEKGWTRYYGTFKINLNEVPIMTEKQLCLFIYQQFGPGHYMVFGFMKGRKGFWVFWKGDIDADGFIFDIKKRRNTEEVKGMKEEMDSAEDPWHRQNLNTLIEKEIHDNKKQKYGFAPFLQPSGKRGSFIHWEDD